MKGKTYGGGGEKEEKEDKGKKAPPKRGRGAVAAGKKAPAAKKPKPAAKPAAKPAKGRAAKAKAKAAAAENRFAVGDRIEYKFMIGGKATWCGGIVKQVLKKDWARVLFDDGENLQIQMQEKLEGSDLKKKQWRFEKKSKRK